MHSARVMDAAGTCNQPSMFYTSRCCFNPRVDKGTGCDNLANSCFVYLYIHLEMSLLGGWVTVHALFFLGASFSLAEAASTGVCPARKGSESNNPLPSLEVR